LKLINSNEELQWPYFYLCPMTISRFLLIFLLMCCGGILHAQQTYVGLSGGTHINGAYIEHSLRGSEYNTVVVQQPLVGFHAGVQARYYNEVKDFRKIHSGIGGGIYYFQRGLKQDFFLVESPITRMNYLQIPIEALLFVGSTENRFYLKLGVFTEFLLSYSLPEAPADSLIIIEDFYTYDPDRGDRTFGYGGSAGLGFHKTSGKQSFDINVFFSYALSNFIYTNRIADPTPDTSNFWSAGLQFNYMIPFLRSD
jgi:hypothetical protein